MMPRQRPEGALIQAALATSPLSARKAAERAGMSEARWRQVVKGYQSMGAGEYRPVVGPPKRIARMAQVVGVSPAQLEQAGRSDAAEALRRLPPTNQPAASADLPAGDLRRQLDWIRRQPWPPAEQRRIAGWLIDLDRRAAQERPLRRRAAS